MALKPGERLASAACLTQVVVVRPPSDGASDLWCAGKPMVSAAAATPPASPTAPPAGAAALSGKRYEDVPSGLELLCTKGGGCIPEVSGRALTVKEAKPLPSSD